eukprot:550685_1
MRIYRNNCCNMGLVESCGNDCKDISICRDTKQDKLWKQKVIQEHKHQMTSLIKDKNINEQMQSIKEENEQLTLTLNDLTQKLQHQISENQILRKELILCFSKTIKIINTYKHKRLTQTQMNSDNYEEELCDETLKNININIQKPLQEINEISQ